METKLIRTINGFALVIDNAERATALADALDQFSPLNCIEIRMKRSSLHSEAVLMLSPEHSDMSKEAASESIDNVLQSLDLRWQIEEANKWR